MKRLDLLQAWLVGHLFGFIVGCLVSGCATIAPKHVYYSSLQSVTNYKVVTPKTTPLGVKYGGDLDAAHIDRVVTKVANCLKTVPEPTPEERIKMDCPMASIRRDVDLQAFDVFMAPDWRASANDPTEQVIPLAKADPKLCFGPISEGGKNLECLNPPCDCFFRAVVQGNRHIIVTPNLKLLPEALTRLVTACNFVWAKPLQECATPVP